MVRGYVDGREPYSGRVFRLTRQRVYGIIVEAAEAAGFQGKLLLNPESGAMKRVSPHRFRDAFAIRALGSNPSVEGQIHLQRHLGHQSFATTTRYIKFAPSEEQDWYRDLWKGEDSRGV